MKYNDLLISRQKNATRVGRGISAGRGKTAGRGTKGQGSRKSSTKAGFEGGQMPLVMRLPKLRGFKPFGPVVENVNTGQLDQLKSTTVDSQSLAQAGLISNPYVVVKLIVKGELNTKKTVKLPAASQAAIEMIVAAGGSFEKVARLGRPSKKSQPQ